jgi:hypothetical protein
MSLMDVLTGMGLFYSSPATFLSLLSVNGMFTSTGKLTWSIDRIFPITTMRLNLVGTAAYDEAVRQLSQGTSVLLQVLTDRGTLHWVAAAKVVDGDIEIRDPNGGRIGTLGSLYGVSALRGLATISRRG